MVNMAKVGIVIVNYNGEKFQNECIASLKKMDYQDYEVIVVDSGSTDNSIKILRENYPDVHILKQNNNVGVAVGNNIGIDYSIKCGTEYTLLMNNDVELDYKMLSIMLENADEHTVVVPKIYYYNPSDILWFAGGKMNWREATGEHIGLGERDEEQYNKIREIDYSPTCCMLIHNSIFRKIGKVEEKTFMYFDDTDLCVRIIDSGNKIKYIPMAKMWHKVSSSSGGEKSKYFVYYNTRNHFYFMDKYKNKIKWNTKLYVGFKYLIKYFLSPIRCKNERYILKAYKDYKNNIFGRVDDL